MMNYDNNHDYVRIKHHEMRQRAEQHRLTRRAQSGRKVMIYRFYHVALAQLGRWLVISGIRLQRRYGQLTEFSQQTHKPIPSKRRV